MCYLLIIRSKKKNWYRKNFFNRTLTMFNLPPISPVSNCVLASLEQQVAVWDFLLVFWLELTLELSYRHFQAI